MRNLHNGFDWHYLGQISDFAKFCDLLRIYELYFTEPGEREKIKLVTQRFLQNNIGPKHPNFIQKSPIFVIISNRIPLIYWSYFVDNYGQLWTIFAIFDLSVIWHVPSRSHSTRGQPLKASFQLTVPLLSHFFPYTTFTIFFSL